ncbi:MAG: phosphatidate cytidylyltransferase [Pirellulales bacterium]
MLRHRLLLGTLFVAALVALCWLDCTVTRPGAILLPLALVLGLVGVSELLAMFHKGGRTPLPWVLYAGVLLAILLSGIQVACPAACATAVPGWAGWLAIGLALGLVLAFAGEIRSYDGQRPTTINLALEAFTILYLGGCLGFIAQLRGLSGGRFGTDGRTGMLALISLIAIVKMSDIGQYTVGRLVGRHKLSPLVSPGKTWEGALGGVLFAIFAAWIVFGWAANKILTTATAHSAFFSDFPRALHITLYAIALAVSGIIGDLAESMLKRDAGVKDSSNWMPGFGGVLDLLDSLLGAAPIAYLCWATGFVTP